MTTATASKPEAQAVSPEVGYRLACQAAMIQIARMIRTEWGRRHKAVGKLACADNPEVFGWVSPNYIFPHDYKMPKETTDEERRAAARDGDYMRRYSYFKPTKKRLVALSMFPEPGGVRVGKIEDAKPGADLLATAAQGYREGKSAVTRAVDLALKGYNDHMRYWEPPEWTEGKQAPELYDPVPEEGIEILDAQACKKIMLKVWGSMSEEARSRDGNCLNGSWYYWSRESRYGKSDDPANSARRKEPGENAADYLIETFTAFCDGPCIGGMLYPLISPRKGEDGE